MDATARNTARVHRAAAASLRREAARLRAAAPALEDEHRTAYGVVVRPRAAALADADRCDRQADEHALAALDLTEDPLPQLVAP